MSRSLVRSVLGILVLIGWYNLAPAQDQRKEERANTAYQDSLNKQAQEDYQLYIKPPTTPAEFWAAINFEIRVGRYGLAADFLKGLLKVTNDPQGLQALVQVEEQEGLESFLRLRGITNWVDNPTPLSDDPKIDRQLRDKINKEANANVEELIGRVTKGMEAYLSDPARFQKLVQDLLAGGDSEAYAVVELRRSGPRAIPFLIQTLRTTTDSSVRSKILETLAKLKRDIDPPLLAALDLEDDNLLVELIHVLRQRADTGAVPNLWYLSAAPQRANLVRQEARKALAYFQEVKEDNLPQPKAALTQEAEKYYQHRIAFPNPLTGVQLQGDTRMAVVWQLQNQQLVSKVMTISQAEEYYGLRFARQALDLDPAYHPAQVVFLSVALEKGVERAGVDQPLGRGAPGLKELLETVNPDLVRDVLARAVADRRVPVILGAVRTLGDLGDVQAARPGTSGPPVLVRALYFPDQRVQLAAADALLRLPGPPPAGAGARVVEVLRRNLAVRSAATVLVAYASRDQADQVARAVRQAGFEAVVVTTGRAVLEQVKAAAGIDAILVDSQIPDFQLPYLLAQLRADVDAGLLPILVTVPEDYSKTAPPEQRFGLHQLVEHYRNAWIIPFTLAPGTLKTTLTEKIEAAMGKPVSTEERQND
ncbi:MAG: hypothetical protein JO112_10685, partial [Planctomycetes bacterium]|nr:hypothetical protein [Planctomycetota bacterium]